ncbi:MAG: hypothetical protein QM292_02160 [Bacteroidota bacterium]|jgi:hypothetical protein|nr:hypothetical protein [Bacteroidales bacterium]MDI9575227.1 hypothetical protein [Bacteroidota bacterium]
MTNLDYICAKIGQNLIVKADENIFRKALGILQEDGVYAMFLWLEKEDSKIRKKLNNLLNENEITSKLLSDSKSFPDDFKGFCEKLQEVAKDIDKLLFLKKILERTLTYALYHAKIKEEENVGKN